MGKRTYKKGLAGGKVMPSSVERPPLKPRRTLRQKLIQAALVVYRWCRRIWKWWLTGESIVSSSRRRLSQRLKRQGQRRKTRKGST